MLARSRELIRCRCATALSGSSHPSHSGSSSAQHPFLPSSFGGGSLADAHSRTSALESTRTGTTRSSSSTSIAPRLSSASAAAVCVSASAADLAFVSSLAAHFQEQHAQQQRKLRQQAPLYQQLHESHRRSPFAHVAAPRSTAVAVQSSSTNDHASSHRRDASALRIQIDDVTECELPMDMECGCKTKRRKEQQDAEALARATLSVRATLSNQQDDSVATIAAANTAVTTASTAAASQTASVVVTSSHPAPLHAHQHQHQHQPQSNAAIAYESSFHRRHLPQDCIAFSSVEGRKLFTQAINSATNYMQIYFPLAEQFITQAEPAFCGLATLAMCLNALQIDPGRLWKGPWRWFSEELFDCCTSLSVAKEKGISLSEFICLARCNGVLTDDVRANDALSLDAFRAIVKRSCATSNEVVVLNYSRKVLGQTGDGHFSPIGGYHEENDMVLLLDVARFKYPPHWVRLSLVFEAMQKLDASSGLPRGLVVLKENAHATGPTLVKQLVHSATPELLLKPAPTVCCDSAMSIESARHVTALAAHS